MRSVKLAQFQQSLNQSPLTSPNQEKMLADPETKPEPESSPLSYFKLYDCGFHDAFLYK
jgi:hypothetical protein